MPPVTIMDTQKAYNFVLDNVGATFPKRDAVDTRVIKTVRTGKAIYVKDAPEFVSPYVKKTFAGRLLQARYYHRHPSSRRTS